MPDPVVPPTRVNSTAFPPGRICGQRWVVSPGAISATVTGAPPAAGTQRVTTSDDAQRAGAGWSPRRLLYASKLAHATRTTAITLASARRRRNSGIKVELGGGSCIHGGMHAWQHGARAPARR